MILQKGFCQNGLQSLFIAARIIWAGSSKTFTCYRISCVHQSVSEQAQTPLEKQTQIADPRERKPHKAKANGLLFSSHCKEDSARTIWGLILKEILHAATFHARINPFPTTPDPHRKNNIRKPEQESKHQIISGQTCFYWVHFCPNYPPIFP